MVSHYRTYSPDSCDCSFELEVDDQGTTTLAFAHNFCPAHKPIADQTTLSQAEITQKRTDIANKLETALVENRTRNLANYDNSPTIITRNNAARNMMLDLATEAQGLLAQANLTTERDFIVRSLDNHDIDARNTILNTVYGNDLAFNADNVFAIVSEENQRKNIALQTALDNGPVSLYDIKDGSRQLKETVKYSFTLTGTAPNRGLAISFTGITLTNQQKTTIRTFLNSKLGVGKAVLV